MNFEISLIIVAILVEIVWIIRNQDRNAIGVLDFHFQRS